MKTNAKNRTSRKLNKLFYLVFIPGMLCQHVYAATYYVSPSGSDSNTGTTLTTPVKTITKGLSKALSSGDIVYVRAGTYNETVMIRQSNITLSAYQNEKPVIDGGTTLPNRDWAGMMTVDGNYVTVTGFEVKNSNINGTYQYGVGVQSAGNHNTFSKMNVHHTWANGIILEGDYNTVEDSSVWQTNQMKGSGKINGWGSGLSAARNHRPEALIPHITSYATIRRNKVYNNWGEGLSCYEVDHCTVEDNVVYDNYAVNLYLSDATNSVVQRNLIYISSAPAITLASREGIALADEVSTVPRSVNNRVVNNFLHNVNFSAFNWSLVVGSGLRNAVIANNTIVNGNLSTGYGGSTSVTNTNSQIRNNIVTGTASKVPSAAGITFSSNNWAVRPSLAASSTDIVGNPQLEAVGSTAPGALTPDYFKLNIGSPVINAGVVVANVSEDFFKTPRDAYPDLGGYEDDAADVTPPSVPANLSATVGSSTQVNLVWNAATDNVGVVGYKLYRNGVEIADLTKTSFADSTVQAGTAYSYTVKAYDEARNISNASNTATVQTPNTPTTTSTTNIAPSAQLISASSQATWNSQYAIKAVDGVLGGYPTDPTHEWSTARQGAGAWIELNWSTSRKVSSVSLSDRPNLNDQITSATLSFSDGSSVSVGTLDNAGKEVVVNFPAKYITRVRLTVNTVSGKTVNVGLAELKVFGQ